MKLPVTAMYSSDERLIPGSIVSTRAGTYIVIALDGELMHFFSMGPFGGPGHIAIKRSHYITSPLFVQIQFVLVPPS